MEDEALGTGLFGQEYALQPLADVVSGAFLQAGYYSLGVGFVCFYVGRLAKKLLLKNVFCDNIFRVNPKAVALEDRGKKAGESTVVSEGDGLGLRLHTYVRKSPLSLGEGLGVRSRKSCLGGFPAL